MKKIYINPNITIVNIQTLSMLANSTLGVSSVEVNGANADSRGNGFWDDDEDY